MGYNISKVKQFYDYPRQIFLVERYYQNKFFSSFFDFFCFGHYMCVCEILQCLLINGKCHEVILLMVFTFSPTKEYNLLKKYIHLY